MNLFQMKPYRNGTNRMAEFLKENFISYECWGIDDLSNVGKDQLKELLAQSLEEGELAERLEELNIFVYGMQDGDFLLAVDEDTVHVGDMGDYYYIESYDPDEDAICHRRGVTWLKTIRREELNKELRKFIDRSGVISQYGKPVTAEQMEHWLTGGEGTGKQDGPNATVDDDTVAEALDILKAAMRSEDTERRERAAIAILQYSSRCNGTKGD